MGGYVCKGQVDLRWVGPPREGFMADPPVPMCLTCCSLPRAKMMLTMSLQGASIISISVLKPGSRAKTYSSWCFLAFLPLCPLTSF